ncbi:DUF433 domain-containing protein [Candidatus Gracilibacteria bacterium]|nr:DUF433 domain-containing protein [Candidatus Gracilibacteria bacterium]
MSLTETRYEHIILIAEGVPLIAGTTTKVIELVRETQAYGWSPEELHFQHPYLSLGKIHSALAYYWDHQVALDADMAQRAAIVAAMRANADQMLLQDKIERYRQQPHA